MTNPDNVGGLVWYVCTSCMLMVQLPSDTPTLGRCQCSPKGWSLRRAKLPKGYELCRAAPAGGAPESLVKWERDYDDTHLAPYCREDVKRLLADWRASIAAPAGGDGPDKAARDLYVKWVDSQDIHCNRFPSWGELSESQKQEWRDKVSPFPPRLQAAINNVNAPAGSGEVVVPAIERMLVDAYAAGMNGDNFDMLAARRNLSALLRKLQQGADKRLLDALKRADALAVCCTAVDSYSRNELWDIAEAFRAHIRPLIASQGQEGGANG